MSLICWGRSDRELLLICLVMAFIVAAALLTIIRGVWALELRSLAEQRKKGELCRRVFNSSNDAIFIHGFDGTIPGGQPCLLRDRSRGLCPAGQRRRRTAHGTRRRLLALPQLLGCESPPSARPADEPPAAKGRREASLVPGPLAAP